MHEENLKSRRLIRSMVALALMAQGCTGEPATDATQKSGEVIRSNSSSQRLVAPGRYIIKYKKNVGIQSAKGIAALKAQGANIKVELGPQNAVAAELNDALLASLRGNPDIEYIEPDPLRYPMAQQVPFGIDMVQAPLVWPQGSSTSRKLCIIDSGLYVAHEDIQDSNVAGYPSGWNTDGCGHGTHVAGTIAGLNNDVGVVGVNPNGVSLYIVKFFGNDCSASFASSLVDSLNRCKSNGANVVSMSLGGQFSSTTERDAFQTAFNEGVLTVAAAGNAGDTSYSYPASYPSVISVAAIDSNKQVTSFSQKNDQIDVAAPGAGVLSTWPAQENSSVAVSGTSYVATGIDGTQRTNSTGVSGVLVDGGLCNATGSWSGKMVLCERGSITFGEKVKNVQNSGGVGAIIYNNVPGGFKGGLGQGESSTIPAVSITQADGQYLKANKLGISATVVSQVIKPANGYEGLDGTSMAAPHVSGVAALIWSVNPSWTNVQIRQALESTAQDLGTAGRDNSYGYGLVQAKAALDMLTGNANTSPTAAYTSSCSGLTCNFTDGSTDPDGSIASWSWNFGDGSTSTVASPSHAYAAAGTYTVSLTVTDNKGATNTATKNLSVGVSDTTAPSTSITAPASGASVSGTATISASATDNVGVTLVEFYVDGGLVGTDTTAPYSFDWNTTPAKDGSHTLATKAHDAAGNIGASAEVSVTVSNGGGGACGISEQLLLNPGFEGGNVDWTADLDTIDNSATNAHSGNWKAWLNGVGFFSMYSMYQQISIPSTACSASFSFWLKITTAETTTTTAYDTLAVQVQDSAGTPLATLGSYSNLNAGGYVQKTFDLSAYKGQTIRIYFAGFEDFSKATSFYVDDTAVNITR